jgi:cytidylate kinase
LKIYLTARPEIRAARRADETVGESVASVAADLHRRDTVGSSRAASPLMAAEDAVVIDTSDISQVEVIAEVLRLVGERRLA